MNKEKVERGEKKNREVFGIFGKVWMVMTVLGMALLGMGGICIYIVGYETIGTTMVWVAIIVNVGVAMVVGLKWIREEREWSGRD